MTIETLELTETELMDTGFITTSLDAAGLGDAQLEGAPLNSTEMLASEASFLLASDTWTEQAACRTEGSLDLFFSEELTEIAAAKLICAECPVLAPCLEGALDRAEQFGVWGGQLFADGVIIAQKRRRGRPPKVARPEDQLPVIPVPVHLQHRVASAA